MCSSVRECLFIYHFRNRYLLHYLIIYPITNLLIYNFLSPFVSDIYSTVANLYAIIFVLMLVIFSGETFRTWLLNRLSFPLKRHCVYVWQYLELHFTTFATTFSQHIITECCVPLYMISIYLELLILSVKCVWLRCPPEVWTAILYYWAGISGAFTVALQASGMHVN